MSWLPDVSEGLENVQWMHLQGCGEALLLHGRLSFESGHWPREVGLHCCGLLWVRAGSILRSALSTSEQAAGWNGEGPLLPQHIQGRGFFFYSGDWTLYVEPDPEWWCKEQYSSSRFIACSSEQRWESIKRFCVDFSEATRGFTPISHSQYAGQSRSGEHAATVQAGIIYESLKWLECVIVTYIHILACVEITLLEWDSH